MKRTIYGRVLNNKFGGCPMVPLLRRVVVVGGGLGALTLARRPASGDNSAALNALWSAAFDGMIDVPGAGAVSSPEGVFYMAPAEAGIGRRGVEWVPPPFREGPVFSLTGYNPMGETHPHEANERANRKLSADIALLEAPRPRAWWHSFGFSAGEGWRENGFSIAYRRADADAARASVLGLARRYRQAAIYEYEYVEPSAESATAAPALVRRVIWVEPGKGKGGGGAERMAHVRKPPKGRLASRDGGKVVEADRDGAHGRRAAEASDGAAAVAEAEAESSGVTGGGVKGVFYDEPVESLVRAF